MNKYLNTQKYSECQLVTAINAATFLGQGGVDNNSIEYERLVDMVFARSGAAINIELAHRYLGIDKQVIERKDFTFDNVANKIYEGHPVEARVFSPKSGHHSVLVINFGEDFHPKTKKITNKTKKYRWVQVLNLKEAKNTYIPWDDLVKMLLKKTKNPLSNKVGYYFFIEELRRHQGSIEIEGFEKGKPFFMSSEEQFKALWVG